MSNIINEDNIEEGEDIVGNKMDNQTHKYMRRENDIFVQGRDFNKIKDRTKRYFLKY